MKLPDAISALASTADEVQAIESKFGIQRFTNHLILAFFTLSGKFAQAYPLNGKVSDPVGAGKPRAYAILYILI